MTCSLRNAGLVLSPILAMAWHGNALAYRPFDGTDAAVAEPGQVEIELGPAQYLQIGSERTLVALRFFMDSDQSGADGSSGM